MPLLCFAHGTELKMYANERRGDQPDEFPLRFLPFMQREKIFDYADPEHGVDMVAAISAEQIEALLGRVPGVPARARGALATTATTSRSSTG